MQCTEAFELLCGHLDHENTPQEEAALQAHLQDCADCRQLLQQLEENDAALSGLRQEAPPQLLKGVMEQIKNPNPEPVKKPKKLQFRFTAIAAAAVLVLLIGTGTIPLFNQEYKGDAYDQAASAAEEAAPADGTQQPEAAFQAGGSLTDTQAADSAQFGTDASPVTKPESQMDYQAMADQEGCDILVLYDRAAAQLPQLQDLPAQQLEDGATRYTLARTQLDSLLDALEPDAYAYFSCSTAQDKPVTVLLPAGTP